MISTLNELYIVMYFLIIFLFNLLCNDKILKDVDGIKI